MKEARRKYNGGNKNAGRKPKDDEIKLIKKLDKYIDSEMVFDKLEGLISQNNIKAIELYLSYRYGKPKQSIDQNTTHTINDFDIKDIINFDKS